MHPKVLHVASETAYMVDKAIPQPKIRDGFLSKGRFRVHIHPVLLCAAGARAASIPIEELNAENEE